MGREGLKKATRTAGESPSSGKARELVRNAKTYDKHISEREQKRVGEKRGCSGGTRIIGFSYFRPWMASRIAELRKWRTQRGDDGGSYQLPRLHLQQTNEHATEWYGDESYSRNSRARESLKSTMLRGIKVWFCTRPIFTPFRRGISILIFLNYSP